jgi:hypothetical protein
MEGIYFLAGIVILVASFFLYVTLVEQGKIQPSIPPRYMHRSKTQRGTFGMQRLRSFTSGIR